MCYWISYQRGKVILKRKGGRQEGNYLNMQNSNKTENKYKQVEQAVDIYVNYLFILL